MNSRVLYPYKYACKYLEEYSILNTNDVVQSFIISFLLRALIPSQIGKFINAWNHHPIPRSGLPINSLNWRKNYSIPENFIPTADQAIEIYKTVRNADFTEPHHFVEDIIPLQHRNQRDEKFLNVIEEIGVEKINSNVVNQNYDLFRECYVRCSNIIVTDFPQIY